MNTGRNQKSGYMVALLLVIGLAAFSNSMRELAEIHRFTFDTSRLIAQYIAPAENPQIPQVPQVVVEKAGSCQSHQAVPVVEVAGVQVTVPAPPAKSTRVVRGNLNRPTQFQLARVDKFKKFDFPSAPFEFKVLSDDKDDSDAQLPLTMLKAKNRSRHNIIKLNTRDREMILRTLNRSINLRTAS